MKTNLKNIFRARIPMGAPVLFGRSHFFGPSQQTTRPFATLQMTLAKPWLVEQTAITQDLLVLASGACFLRWVAPGELSRLGGASVHLTWCNQMPCLLLLIATRSINQSGVPPPIQARKRQIRGAETKKPTQRKKPVRHCPSILLTRWTGDA